MANLYTGTIKCDGEYKNIATETGVTFTTGNTYQIQFLNTGYVREGVTGEGFFVSSSDPFSYKCNGDDLYVCNGSSVVINIAE